MEKRVFQVFGGIGEPFPPPLDNLIRLERGDGRQVVFNIPFQLLFLMGIEQGTADNQDHKNKH